MARAKTREGKRERERTVREGNEVRRKTPKAVSQSESGFIDKIKFNNNFKDLIYKPQNIPYLHTNMTN